MPPDTQIECYRYTPLSWVTVVFDRLLTLWASRGLFLGGKGWDPLGRQCFDFATSRDVDWKLPRRTEAPHDFRRRPSLGGCWERHHLELCSLQPAQPHVTFVLPRMNQVFLGSWVSLSALLALNIAQNVKRNLSRGSGLNPSESEFTTCVFPRFIYQVGSCMLSNRRKVEMSSAQALRCCSCCDI